MAKLLGKTQPRLWTPPLRTLTRRTSFGYDVVDFALAAGITLYPPQRWLLVHACELGRDGLPRFRVVLHEAARQNGKTTTALLVALYKMYVWRTRLTVGAAQSLAQARESQAAALEMIADSPLLAAELADVRRGNGQESFTVDPGPLTYDDVDGDESMTLRGSGSRYKIVASDRRAARGLSVGHVFADELREWLSSSGWSALYYTTMAVQDSQIWAGSNMGDDRSTVLNTLHDAALAGRDPSIGLFSWSAPDGCELDDWSAIRQANPLLGYKIPPRAITTAIATERPDDVRAEVFCQRVASLDGVIPWQAWQACADEAGTLAGHRDRVAVCFDAAPDGAHCTLAAAARLDDGRVRVEIVTAWDSTGAARGELPALLARIRPRVVAWYPTGPAAALATVLRAAVSAVRGAEYTELTGNKVAESCQEFTDLIRGRRVLHPADPLLDSDVRTAQRLNSADGWRFGRREGKPVDAIYAAAGAAVAALQVPEPRRARIRIVS